MPTYEWNYDDKEPQITHGLEKGHDFVNVHLIQENDGRGGYNVEFKIKDQISFYHIHFFKGKAKVKVVRYFANRNVQGDNVIVYEDKKEGYGPTEKETLQQLANFLVRKSKKYPNHVKLLRKMRDAWEEADRPGYPKDKDMASYKVSVFTGGKPGAGTNADVYLTIHGDSGKKTDEVQLDNGKDNFEPNQEDKFHFTEKDIHDVNEITIRHNDSGEHAGWFLDRVTVENKKSQKKWVCKCDKWLSTTEGKGKIERTITCEKM